MKTNPEVRMSFADVFRNEYQNLISYVGSYFRNRSDIDAEDIIQDVALNLYNKPDFSRPVENAMAYVYRSLRNKAYDVLRKRSRAPEEQHLDDEFYFFLEAEIAEEADSLMEEDMMEGLMEEMYLALDELPDSQREIIIATELEGRAFESLSKDWDVPIGTLLSRKHRAMGKLSAIMEALASKDE